MAPDQVEFPDAGANELLQLDLAAPAAGGSCVARGPDGRVIFVRHGIPGEQVLARITATNRSFLRADAVQVTKPSPHRVNPPCSHAGPGQCGGCDFQHIDLAGQRQMKSDLVAEQLRRLAGVERSVEVEAVGHNADGLGWRTRVRLGVDRHGKPGFHKHRSHELEYVDDCPISCPAIGETGVFGSAWLGAQEIDVAVTPESDEALIAVDPIAKSKPQLPQLSVGLVVGGRVRQEPGAMHPVVKGVTYRVSAGVFWQVHQGAAEALADAVLEAAGVNQGESIVDLYAGAGLFSVLLAGAVGREGSVVAVERSIRACHDARHNAQGLPQLQIKKASITPNLVTQGLGEPDLLVLDPSRQGAGKDVMTAITQLPRRLRRVIYVACDPASFSRDLAVLLGAGWQLGELRAFDIFPMTEHVELVATLNTRRRTNGSR